LEYHLDAQVVAGGKENTTDQKRKEGRGPGGLRWGDFLQDSAGGKGWGSIVHNILTVEEALLGNCL